MLSNYNTVSWLSKRCKDHVPLHYRTTPEEYQMHIVMESIFAKFDEDHSSNC